MILTHDIQQFFSAGVQQDLQVAIKHAHAKEHYKIKVVCIPVEEFSKAVDALLKQIGAQPFQPMVFGLPCTPHNHPRPGVIIVTDDNTNLVQDVIRQEREEWQQ